MPANEKRITVKPDQDLVVFLIGARVNSFWHLGKAIQVGRAFNRMTKELMDRPELGCLHSHGWGGRISITVQYWKSLDHLMQYARNPDAIHLPAWRDFNKRIASSRAVGIWHETYVVKAGQYEAVYRDLPPFGLRRAIGGLEISDDETDQNDAQARMNPDVIQGKPLPPHTTARG